MWWKISLATVVGIVIGVAATYSVFWLVHDAGRDSARRHLAVGWPSTGKEWPAFADYLRLAGRFTLASTAFTAAQDGMSETEVRATFGPPDHVETTADGWTAYTTAKMAGSGGAYFYKVGRFALTPRFTSNNAFAIVFDPQGKVMYRIGFGVNDGDRLADVDSDTRSDKRIAP